MKLFSFVGIALFFIFPQVLSGQESSVYRLKLHWLPQSQFAGFYVAQADGLYKKAGVEVVLQHPDVQEDIFESLLDGRSDVIVAWPFTALERVEAGEDVVNIGQIAQKSSLMLIARKDSDIRKPEDISGRRVGLWVPLSLQKPFRCYFEKKNIVDFSVFPVLTNADLFLYQGVDVIAGVEYNDYYLIYSSGINADELQCFYLQEEFPGLVDDGLYCKRSTYDKNPDACRRIREATLEGWRRAFDDPKRTLEIVRKECEKNGLRFNLALQRWMLNHMRSLVFPDGKVHDGLMKPKTFAELKRILEIQDESLSYERFVPDATTDR